MSSAISTVAAVPPTTLQAVIRAAQTDPGPDAASPTDDAAASAAAAVPPAPVASADGTGQKVNLLA